jgi:hypothetical protein
MLVALGWSLAWGHDQTQWELRPSVAYDALCLFNTLAGDPYYLGFYQQEFDRYNARMQPAERQAFQQIHQVLKVRQHRVVSSFLVLYFSAGNPETIQDLQKILDHPDGLKAELKKTPYYSEAGWRVFLEIRPQVHNALAALERIEFPADWEREVRPRIQKRIDTMSAELSPRNIVPAVERAVGRELASDRIPVYLLEYSKPMEMRITGARFLTHESYPFDVVLRNAVHEMLHPPYTAADAGRVQKVLDLLKTDKYLMDKVQNHDKSLGYTNLPDYVEEDSVQALEQRITASMGSTRDLRQYWRQQDGGIHVLAVALYTLMEENPFQAKDERFTDFLVRMAESGKLAPGETERRNRVFFGR